MEVIIYTAIFLTGIVFGSFFTLAVYRIPRKENITYVRSHCTTCNHKLNFWDLIPVLSYIFLGGRCRYCKEKIRIRYLLLEVFSGLVFLLVALTTGIENIVNLIFVYLFMAGMFIIAGIDKENLEIPNSVCIYELCVAIIFVIYKLIIEEPVISNIVGLFAIPLILFLINKLILLLVKDENKLPVGCGDIKYLAIIGLMFGFPIQILSIVLSSIFMAIGVIVHKFKEIPWGYYLTIATIVVLIISPYINELIDLINVRSW